MSTDPISTPEGASTPPPRNDEDGRPSGIPEALEYLIQAARSRGRDMKLVSALLRIMADFLTERGADATIAVRTDTNVPTPGSREEKTNAAGEVHPQASISPVLRSRLQAVIDSLSDNETARALAIGTRQVRRRTLAGGLYFFEVGRKRRYPCWQFIGDYRVLPGLHIVTPLLPRDWPPETVDAFMTTQHPQLSIRGVPSSPVVWLAHGGDPSTVSRLLASTARE